MFSPGGRLPLQIQQIRRESRRLWAPMLYAVDDIVCFVGDKPVESDFSFDGWIINCETPIHNFRAWVVLWEALMSIIWLNSVVG